MDEPDMLTVTAPQFDQRLAIFFLSLLHRHRESRPILGMGRLNRFRKIGVISRYIHPVTKIGIARSGKILGQKEQRKRGSKREFAPAKENENLALKSVGITSWKDAEKRIPRTSRVGGRSEITRDCVQLPKKVGNGAEEDRQRAWRKYQEGAQTGKRRPAQNGSLDLKHRLGLDLGLKKQKVRGPFRCVWESSA